MLQSSLERKEPTDNKVVSRRRFLSMGIGAVASFVVVTLGIPLAGYAVSPALQRKEGEWTELGPASDFKPGEPKKVEYNSFRKDGWVEETVKKSAWVVAQENGEFTVFDPRCTHLGCAYRWDDSRKSFLCPCHDGVFDINGNVVSGPPPRPLDRLQVKVEGGKLLVLGG